MYLLECLPTLTIKYPKRLSFQNITVFFIVTKVRFDFKYV